jgi:hypothetical protein
MRHMIWIATARMETWGCSDCAWTFKPSGPPVGNCLEAMIQNFESQRDKDCALHVCAAHAKPMINRDISRLPPNLAMDRMTRTHVIGINAKA